MAAGRFFPGAANLFATSRVLVSLLAQPTMKPVRLLLLVAGLAAVLLLVAGGVARWPGVQRWAVLRAAAGHPGLRLELDTLSAGFTGAVVTGLKLERAGLRVEAGRIELRYAPWAFFTGRRVVLPWVAAEAVLVDVSQLRGAAAGAAAAPAVAPGVLARTTLPWAVELGEVAVRGRARWPGAAGRVPLEADFQLTGGGLAPGATGTLVLAASLRDPTPHAPVARLHTRLALELRQTNERTFDRVDLALVADADGPRLTGRHQLKFAGTVLRGPAGEEISLELDTLLAGGAERLLELRAHLPPGARDFAGTWTVQARTEQVEPFFFGGALPRFTATGAGTFRFAPAGGEVALAGQARVEAARLEVLDPALRALGAVRWESEFDVSAAAGITWLNRLHVRLDGAAPALELTTRRAVGFERAANALRFREVAEGELARLTLHALPLAWVRPWITAADVSGGVARGDFSLLAADGRVRLHPVAPLAVDGLTLVREGRLLLDRADVSLAPVAELAPPHLSLGVREFSLRTPAGDALRGELHASTLLGIAPIVVRGTLAADLPTLLAPWLPLGPLKFTGATEFSATPAQIEVRRLEGELTDADGRRLLASAVVHPFTVDQRQRRVLGGGPDEVPLLRLSHGQWPLALLQPAAPGHTIAGELAAGEFVLAAAGERLVLRAAAPVSFAGVSWHAPGRAGFDRLTFAATPELTYAGPGEWKLAAQGAAVGDARGVTLATLGAEVAATAAEGHRATLTFDADLAALGAQPWFAAARAVSAGRASGEVRAAWQAGTLQTEARATLNGLVARDTGQTLPVANFSFRGVRLPDGRITIEAPLLLDRLGDRSDLKFSAEAVPHEGGYLCDARLGGSQLELGDALALLGVFGAAPEAAPPARGAGPATGAGTADPEPFWTGLRGELALDFAHVARGADWAMTGFGAYLVLDPDRLALQKLEGTINGHSQLAGRADLRFLDRAAPYQLTGNFSLTEFDAGAFFKAFEPGRPPVVEGLFTIAGGLQGEGADLDATLAATRGQFQLTSRQGVFRGLKRASDKVSAATKTVEIGAAIGSIFGTNKVREVVGKVAGSAYQVDQLAQALGELPFDQLVVRATRDEALNFAVEELSLISPELRLHGQGALGYDPATPLAGRPLRLAYQLAARGQLEELFGKLKLLDGTRDELGYARTRDAGEVGGTLARPDPLQYFRRLIESKLTEPLNP